MQPLQNYSLVDTAEVETARALISSVYCDHKLHIRKTDNCKGFRAVHNYVPLGDVSVSFMSYSDEVLIDPGCLDDFYLLQLPLCESRALIRTGKTEFVSEGNSPSLINPADNTRMIWSGGCSQLMVQIRKSALDNVFSQLMRDEAGQPIRFEPRVTLEQCPRMASWWRFVQYLVSDIDHGTFSHLGRMEIDNLKHTLIANLLFAAQHSHTQALQQRSTTPAPRHVKAAEAYMLENVHRAITIGELVEASGVSARALFDAFKRFRGQTPMKCFLQFRLEMIRRELCGASPHETVTDILTRFGITQLGRFAAIYKRRFGESPSETLKQH